MWRFSADPGRGKGVRCFASSALPTRVKSCWHFPVLLCFRHREVLSDIFEMIDLDGNGLLSLEEYNFFELRTSGEKCDKDAWAVCKGNNYTTNVKWTARGGRWYHGSRCFFVGAENFDMRKNQLTRQGFMELNLMEATEKDGDPADLWVTLEAMGYNRMLELAQVGLHSWFISLCLNHEVKTLNPPSYSHQACPFQIDIHCESSQPSIQPLALDSGPKLLNQALQKSITARTGAKALRGHENVLIYTYRGEHRISSLIANKVGLKICVGGNIRLCG